jgi:hypothetical protein
MDIVESRGKVKALIPFRVTPLDELKRRKIVVGAAICRRAGNLYENRLQ